MRFAQVPLSGCDTVSGALVAVDVLRAFSTAAFAFVAGVSKILLAGRIEEAFALRERFPDALLVGENNGLYIPGFDFGNSPSQLVGLDLARRTIILRTSAGTQGIVRGTNAEQLFGCSFNCAQATAHYLRRLAPSSVSFVITGVHAEDRGDEDVSCADYVSALLSGASPDPQPFLDRVRTSATAVKFLDPSQPDFLRADLDCCLRVNSFDRALVVRRENGLMVMLAEK